MIKKQWQVAIDHIEQFRGFAEGDNYSDIVWEGDPIAEQELIDKYQEVKKSFWTFDLKEKRNQLLAECDWTQNRDVSLANDTEWAAYRQALRDITDNYDPFIEEIVWPEKPV